MKAGHPRRWHFCSLCLMVCTHVLLISAIVGFATGAGSSGSSHNATVSAAAAGEWIAIWDGPLILKLRGRLLGRCQLRARRSAIKTPLAIAIRAHEPLRAAAGGGWARPLTCGGGATTDF